MQDNFRLSQNPFFKINVLTVPSLQLRRSIFFLAVCLSTSIIAAMAEEGRTPEDNSRGADLILHLFFVYIFFLYSNTRRTFFAKFFFFFILNKMIFSEIFLVFIFLNKRQIRSWLFSYDYDQIRIPRMKIDEWIQQKKKKWIWTTQKVTNIVSNLNPKNYVHSKI